MELISAPSQYGKNSFIGLKVANYDNVALFELGKFYNFFKTHARHAQGFARCCPGPEQSLRILEFLFVVS